MSPPSPYGGPSGQATFNLGSIIGAGSMMTRLGAGIFIWNLFDLVDGIGSLTPHPGVADWSIPGFVLICDSGQAPVNGPGITGAFGNCAAAVVTNQPDTPTQTYGEYGQYDQAFALYAAPSNGPGLTQLTWPIARWYLRQPFPNFDPIPKPNPYPVVVPGRAAIPIEVPVAPPWVYNPAVDPLLTPMGVPTPVPAPTPFTDIPYVNPLQDPWRDPKEGPQPRTDPWRQPSEVPGVSPSPRPAPRPGIDPVVPSEGVVVRSPRPRHWPKPRVGTDPQAGVQNAPRSYRPGPPRGRPKPREKKLTLAVGGVLGTLTNFITETNDFVSAIFWSIDPSVRPRVKTLQGRMQAIYDHFGDIDWPTAVGNVVKNQLTDWAVGRFNRKLAQNFRGLHNEGYHTPVTSGTSPNLRPGSFGAHF